MIFHKHRCKVCENETRRRLCKKCEKDLSAAIDKNLMNEEYVSLDNIRPEINLIARQALESFDKKGGDMMNV